MARKLVILGLDCADPALVFEAFRSRMPHVSALMECGAWGRLRSCDPPITCPAWMVMMTGASPGELGIYGFRNRTDHSYTKLGLATSAAVTHTTVWDVLSQHGRDCITYGVPLTYPPKPLRGNQVSCFLTPDAASEYTFPKSLKEELTAATGAYIPDVREFRTNDKTALLKRIYEMTEHHATQAKWLLRNKPWDFFMLVEMGIDRIHHGFWNYFDTAHPRYERHPELQNCMADYYAFVDAKLGEILDDVPDDAEVMIVSDHGIQRMVGGIAFNEWLIREGYLVLKRRPETPTPLGQCEIDWARTRAWGDGGYYGRLFLNIKGREPNGILATEDVDAFKNEVTAKLEQLGDEKGNAIGTRVLWPEQIYDRVNGVAPDLLVYFGDLAWRSVGSVGGPVRIHTFENDSGPDAANHALEGIFVLSSKARVKRGTRGRGEVRGLNIRDVARTALRLMDVEAPKAMGGTAMDVDGI